MNKPRRKAASGGWRLQDDRPPTFRGWISTDEGEIGRREWRGRTEIVDVHALDGSPHPFGDYRVTSSSGSSYTVEIRSLGTHINSCGCRDHRTNRLGTCKHIEGVLHRLRGNRAAPPRRRKPKGQESSGRIEIFLDERDDRAVRMTVPEAIERADPAFVQEAARHYTQSAQGFAEGVRCAARHGARPPRPPSVSPARWRPGSTPARRRPEGGANATASWPISRRAADRSSLSSTRSCRTMSRERSISRSESACSLPTTWVWERPSRPEIERLLPDLLTALHNCRRVGNDSSTRQIEIVLLSVRP